MKNHQNWRERSHDITAKIVEDYSFANINEAYKILESFIEKLLQEEREKWKKEVEEKENHNKNKLLDGFAHPKDCIICLTKTPNE